MSNGISYKKYAKRLSDAPNDGALFSILSDLPSSDQLANETRSLEERRTVPTKPDAMQGKAMLRNSIINGIVNDTSYITNRVAPLVAIPSNSDGVSWQQTTYNAQRTTQVPVLGPSRYLTTSSTSGSAGYNRFGISFQVEHGFMNTEAGVLDWHNKIKQMVASCVDSINADCIEALVNCPGPYNKPDAIAAQFQGKTIAEFFQREHEMWDPLKKYENGIYKVATIMANTMQAAGGSGNVLIIPQQVGQYLSLAKDEHNTATVVGAKRAQQVLLNAASVATLKLARDVDVYFVPPLINEERNRKIPEPFKKVLQIGEFAQMMPRTAETSSLPYKTYHRDIKMYSESEDKFFTVTLKDALANCNRFETSVHKNSKEWGKMKLLGDNSKPYDRGGSHSDVEDMWFYKEEGMDGNTEILPCQYHGQMDLKHFGVDDKRNAGYHLFKVIIEDMPEEKAREVWYRGTQLLRYLDKIEYNHDDWKLIQEHNVNGRGLGVRTSGPNPTPVFTNKEWIPNPDTGTLEIPIGIRKIPGGLATLAGLKELARHLRAPLNSGQHNLRSDNADKLKDAEDFVKFIETVGERLHQILPGLGSDPKNASSWWRDPVPATVLFDNYIMPHRTPAFLSTDRALKAGLSTGVESVLQVFTSTVNLFFMEFIGVDTVNFEDKVKGNQDPNVDVTNKDAWAYKHNILALTANGIAWDSNTAGGKSADAIVSGVVALLDAVTGVSNAVPKDPTNAQLIAIVPEVWRMTMNMVHMFIMMATNDRVGLESVASKAAALTKVPNAYKNPLYGTNFSSPSRIITSEIDGLIDEVVSHAQGADPADVRDWTQKLVADMSMSMSDILTILEKNPNAVLSAKGGLTGNQTAMLTFFRAPIAMSPTLAASIYVYTLTHKEFPVLYPSDPFFPEVAISPVKLEATTRHVPLRPPPANMSRTALDDYLSNIAPGYTATEFKGSIHHTSIMQNPRAHAVGLAIHDPELVSSMIGMNLSGASNPKSSQIRAKSILNGVPAEYRPYLNVDADARNGDPTVYREYLAMPGLANANWDQSYTAIEQGIPDKLSRMFAHYYDTTPIDLQTYTRMLDYNVPVPFGFLIVRPHATYETQGMLKVEDKGRCAINFQGDVQFEIGDDAKIQKREVTTTYWHKLVVMAPENVYYAPTAFVCGYNGGMGSAWVSPENYHPRVGANDGGSLISMMVPYTFQAEPSISLTGNWNMFDHIEFAKPYPNTNYGTADFYNSYYRWNEADSLRDVTTEDDPTVPLNINTVVHQGHTFYFNPTTSTFETVEIGRGHWGSATYLGCNQVRKGLFQKMEMNHWTGASSKFTLA